MRRSGRAFWLCAVACLVLIPSLAAQQPDNRSVKALESAAAAGNAAAQYALGATAENEGRTADALAWYQKAAAQGYPVAVARLKGSDSVAPVPPPVGRVATVRATTARDARIRIFVAPMVRDGFVDVDSGVLDSIKDIQEELGRSKELALAPAASEAMIVLTVIGRRVSGTAGAIGVTTGGTTFGGSTIAGVKQPTYTTPGVTTMVPIDRRAIDTVLRVGAYEKTTASEDGGNGSWRFAARQVVKDVSAWAAANRSQLGQ